MDVNVEDPDDGNTALTMAVWKGDASTQFMSASVCIALTAGTRVGYSRVVDLLLKQRSINVDHANKWV